MGTPARKEVSAVVQEGNGDSLDWHGGRRDGEQRIEKRQI